MKIERVPPEPPAAAYSLTFSRDEGWAIVAALDAYADLHPEASKCDDWKRWARELDAELRR